MSKVPIDAQALRIEAEARVALLATQHPIIGIVDQARLIHELQVHQIELEMQGESLRQASLALEESRNRYQDLYELAPVGYLTLARSGAIEQINLTGTTLLGVDRVKLIGQLFSSLVWIDDSTRWQKFFSTMLRLGGSGSEEFRLKQAGTGELHVRLDCLAVRGERGDFLIHIAMINISERKLAEKQLREQEQLFRTIAEQLDGFVAVLDLSGRRIYNSPSYENLLGTSNIAGGNCFEEVHAEDRERVRRAFAETIASGVGQHLEYRFIKADGEVRTMESRGSVARDDNGQIRYVVVLSNDVTERKLGEQKIRHLAFYDSLTGLPNRRTLNDRLQQAMAASKRSGNFGALLFLDLDQFKPLNDAYGHAMGDQLLAQVAQRITECVREIDTVARFGGDEFVVVLSELDISRDKSLADTRIIAEKMRLVIAQPYELQMLDKNGCASTINHQCTASIGVVLFMNHDQSEEDVLKLADIAMYRAKNSGRDAIHFHGSDGAPN